MVAKRQGTVFAALDADPPFVRADSIRAATRRTARAALLYLLPRHANECVTVEMVADRAGEPYLTRQTVSQAATALRAKGMPILANRGRARGGYVLCVVVAAPAI